MCQLVAYYRVSTKQQEGSGLGLEAQRAAVRVYADSSDCEVIAEYQETESGKSDENRPKLREALDLCELTGAKLVIAKLDRLSRNVAFLANLMESSVQFVACDNPQANELTIHILAAVAQEERRAISQRTKAALAAAKAHGVILGNPRIAEARSKRKDGISMKAATNARQRNADNRAMKLEKVVNSAKLSGARTLQELANYLNQNTNITTSRNCKWTRASVSRIVSRIASLKANHSVMSEAIF